MCIYGTQAAISTAAGELCGTFFSSRSWLNGHQNIIFSQSEAISLRSGFAGWSGLSIIPVPLDIRVVRY